MSDEDKDDEVKPPKFDDVVRAMTPPGTDFEEFKKSLHSQGAPGRVSPGMIAAMNAGGITLPQTASGFCSRCEHPHAGEPGPICLEAERHLGRSPRRRSPDLQLDEISRPAGPPPDPFPGPASVAAIAAHEMFLDFMRGGFNEDQALKLVALMIRNAGGENPNPAG